MVNRVRANDGPTRSGERGLGTKDKPTRNSKPGVGPRSRTTKTKENTNCCVEHLSRSKQGIAAPTTTTNSEGLNKSVVTVNLIGFEPK